MAEMNWRRREKRVLQPFATSDHAFDNVRFAPTGDSQLSYADKYYVDRTILESGLQPRISFSFDPAVLVDDTPHNFTSIRLAISARDLARRKYSVLKQWPIEGVPANWHSDSILPSHEGIDFQVIAFLAHSSTTAPGQAWRKSSILAKKAFSVKPRVLNTLFPIVSADFGDDERLFEVRWLADSSFNDNVERVLELEINHSCYQHVQALESSREGHAFLRLLTAQVFEEVAQRVLEEYPHAIDLESNEDGLLTRVMQFLEEASGYAPEEIQRRASEEPGFLRTQSQHIVKIVDSVKGIQVKG